MRGTVLAMAKSKYWAFVAYHDGVEKVRVVKRKASTRGLVQPCKDPTLVEDEEGTEFVVPASLLYDNPMQAHLAAAKMAKAVGAPAPRANPVEDEDPDEDDPEEEEDEDEEDPDDEDLDDEDD